MDEKTVKIVIDTLAEAIDKLQRDLFLTECENKRLREKVAQYEKETEKVGKNNA